MEIIIWMKLKGKKKREKDTIILKGSLEILEKERHILLHIYFLLYTIILQTDFSQNREKRNLIIIIWKFWMKLKGKRKREKDTIILKGSLEILEKERHIL